MAEKKDSLALARVISLKPSIGLPVVCESVGFMPKRGAMAENRLEHNIEFGVTDEGKVKNLVDELSRILGTKIDMPSTRNWGESTLFSMQEKDWRCWGKVVFIRNPDNPKTGFLKFETTILSSNEHVAQRMREVMEKFRTRRGGIEELRKTDGSRIKLRIGLGAGFDDASVLWMRDLLSCRRLKHVGRKTKTLKMRTKKMLPKRPK